MKFVVASSDHYMCLATTVRSVLEPTPASPDCPWSDLPYHIVVIFRCSQCGASPSRAANWICAALLLAPMAPAASAARAFALCTLFAAVLVVQSAGERQFCVCRSEQYFVATGSACGGCGCAWFGLTGCLAACDLGVAQMRRCGLCPTTAAPGHHETAGRRSGSRNASGC